MACGISPEQVEFTWSYAFGLYASASTVGSSMLVVDAINGRAAAFYEGNGFMRLPDSMRLVLSMHVIEKMLKD